jgi:hypothetical protein
VIQRLELLLGNLNVHVVASHFDLQEAWMDKANCVQTGENVVRV